MEISPGLLRVVYQHKEPAWGRDTSRNQFQISAEAIKQFIPGQIKCLSDGFCTQMFFNETSETELIVGLSEK